MKVSLIELTGINFACSKVREVFQFLRRHSGSNYLLTNVFAVLNNLLSNAIKFTDDGYVSLSIRDCPDDNMIEFCIQDTGKGIPEDRLEIIFEPFRQVEFGDTRKHGGTGLGLTICKKLIEIMGGTLRVESCVKRGGNQGSRFCFTLPYEAASLVDEEASTKIKGPLPSSQCQSSCKILLAEDDPVSRKVATRLLETAGFDVMPALDGAEAVTLFEKHRATIDLILMDVMMPNMDGLEATERIREIEASSGNPAQVPIIALSAGAMKGDRERGIKAGMTDYLYKPINRALLLDALGTYLGSVSKRSDALT